MIRVVLVDDQTLMREGLRRLLDLAGDIAIVAEARDGDEAVAVITRTRPDAVLLDVRLPRRSGTEVLRLLRAAGCLPPTILLTTFDDDVALIEGIKAGAKGFLLKDVSLDDLTQAVRHVAAGGSLFRPAVTERVRREAESVPQTFESLDPPDRLTRRETEVLQLMAGGYTNRDIAEALAASEGTIKNHVSNILSKFGVRSRTQAVLKGMKLGYMSAGQECGAADA